MKKLLIGLSAFTLLFILFRPKEILYSIEKSPDGRHMVEVYRISPWYQLKPAPGSSADAPVVIYLKTSEGKVIERWDDEMLQSSGPVTWAPYGVGVGGHSHWWKSDNP